MPSSSHSASNEPVLTLHTSWRGLVAAWFTPIVLLAFGAFALRDGGARSFPLLLVVSGAVLLLVVLLDYPHRVTISEAGITRHTLLRTHHLRWDRLVALERTRPATTTLVRNATDRRRDPQISGGLVARAPGRRRWLLTDRVESRIEYDRLVALLARLEAPARLRAARPHAEAPPTFLYRRHDVGGR